VKKAEAPKPAEVATLKPGGLRSNPNRGSLRRVDNAPKPAVEAPQDDSNPMAKSASTPEAEQMDFTFILKNTKRMSVRMEPRDAGTETVKEEVKDLVKDEKKEEPKQVDFRNLLKKRGQH